MVIIQIDLGNIPGVFGALFVFGFGYNLLTDWLEHRGYDEGYTALLVVGGVGITILGLSLLSMAGALIVLGAFACSGFWMVIGSMWRHARRREKSQRAIIDDQTTEMAE